jgi:hypothetical protein
METDSQKRSVGQIEKFIKNLRDFSMEEARKLLEFFDWLRNLYKKNLYSELLVSFGNHSCSFPRIFQNFANYCDPDGPASPSSSQFELSSGGGVG